MSKNRAFVPSAPLCSALEERIAPANVFGLGGWWDKTVDNLGLRHHHETSNTDIVANTWKHSKAIGVAHPAHSNHVTSHPATITFK